MMRMRHLQIVKEFTEPAAVAVKHMNPCGVGTGKDIVEAYEKAFEADPTIDFWWHYCFKS